MPKPCWMYAIAGLLLFSSASNCCFGAGARFTVDKSWTTEEGLPQNSIITMEQSHDGYLWLGTVRGLVRFDGIGQTAGAGLTQFPVFDDSNTPGLESKTMVKVFEDRDGNLWIGTETTGVVLVEKTGKVTGVDIGRGGREGRLMSICEDSQGAVWLYTADGQLCRYRNRKVDIWKIDADARRDCRVVISEPGGLIWVGTDWSLISIDPARVVSDADLPSTPHHQEGRLDFLLESKQRGHWRMGNGRIQRVLGGQVTSTWAYPWTNAVRIVAACEDAEGRLFVGTYGAGVFCFDSTGQSSQLQGGSSSYILSLLIDREGCLWVGTDGGGLNRVKRQPFAVLDNSRGLVVQSVCEDNQGALWIGYNWELIHRWSEGQVQQFTNLGSTLLPMRSPLYVRSMFCDDKNQVWAGTLSAGGARSSSFFQLHDGQFRERAESVVQDVSAIYQDRQGVLWVGMQYGLARWDGRNWEQYTPRNGLSSSNVRAIAEDNEGNLWVGTQAGLNQLREGKFTVFRKQQAGGLPSEDISSLYVDRENVLWIGTSLGLVRKQADKWTRYTTEQGLISNSIGYVVEDGTGYLWIGSNAGLMRVPKKALNDFAAGSSNSIPCRVYGTTDGLPTRECTFGSQPGACRTRDGLLWFPTIRGLAFVNPTELSPNSNPPPVVIEAILVEGRPKMSQGLRATRPETITISPSEEHLEIHYTSLNLTAPERARFRYRMERHESAWIEAGKARAAHYSKLPPGEYRFQVTACNEDDVWNEQAASIGITVLPPIWRTWWFISLMSLALLAMVVGSVHYVSTQKLQRQLAGLRQKEALEKERARISRDLHDQLGANLTQVALLGELAETDKDDPAEVEAHARQISQTARETTRALDEIVWTVNPSNDTVDGLINYLCKYAQEYFAMAGLRYRLEVPDHLPTSPISPELRHNVFLAAKEAVNNVVKHANASSAWLRLRIQLTGFVLEIEDNGRGLGQGHEKSTRSGLRNMRKRMEDVGGEFAIGPGAEGGTLVRLSVPLRVGGA